MKATPKQWAFLGVFTGAVAITFTALGYRILTPPHNSPKTRSSATETATASAHQPVRRSLGRRRAYSLPSSPKGDESEKGSASGKESSGRRESVSPGTSAAPSGSSSRSAPALDTPELVTYSLDDYLTIVDLDPFTPVIPKAKPTPKPTPRRSPSRELPPFPPQTLTPQPLLPAEEPEVPSPPLPGEAPPSPSDSPTDLAVTGYVQTRDQVRILLENVKTQEGRMVRPGDEVFGHRVKYIDRATEQLVLEKGGREIRLKLGANKKEVRAPKRPSGNNLRGPRGTGNPAGSEAQGSDGTENQP